MFPVEPVEVSDEFLRCYNAAGRHFLTQVQGQLGFLKSKPQSPFLEHLSFRLGNQLFFVRLEDVDANLKVPGHRAGLQQVADGNKGHACIMPMRRKATDWEPEKAGWGLVDARTGGAIDPIALVSDERIEMTDWELQDFAVQVVRDDMARRGIKLSSTHGYVGLDPAIWFEGDSGPEWVVVRAVRFPATQAEIPKNWQAIAQIAARLGKVGHFASVAVASADDAFDPTGDIPATPLWRGHALTVWFTGLKTI